MLKSSKVILITIFMFVMSMQAMADTSSIVSRIIGGTAAADGEFPFQVQLVTDNGNSYSTFCGGTIISSTWILTAAHCVSTFDTPAEVASLYVMSGTNVWDQTKLTAVSQVIVHANYGDTATYNNDIALLELSTAVTSDPIDNLSTTILPYYTTGTVATVSGWGDTDASSVTSYPTDLMKVDVPVVSPTVCGDSYGSSLTTNMLCAGLAEGGVDSCQGDSGGPLFINNNDGTFSLIGIVSFGQGCAQPNYYGVYTKVAEYSDWIDTNTSSSITGSGVSELYNLSAVAADSSVSVDTATVASYDENVESNQFDLAVVGGNVETLSVATDAQTLELLYTTKAKINLKVAPTSGYDDVAVVLDYGNLDPDYYKVIMCSVTSSLLTCSEREDVTYDSTNNWARFYLKNNELYDYNQYGVAARGVDDRAITDKIDVDIYLARSYNADDVIAAVTGGGGCSISNESAYGLSVLIFFCVIFIMRRKMTKAIKAHKASLDEQ